MTTIFKFKLSLFFFYVLISTNVNAEDKEINTNKHNYNIEFKKNETSVNGQPVLKETNKYKINNRFALPFPPGSNIKPETVCGLKDDLIDVEFYKGQLGATEEYVRKHEGSTVQLQWLAKNEMQAKLPPNYSLGNVASERWCTGTLISQKHVLTAGHCFDIQNGSDGWTTPHQGSLFAEPKVLATLLKINFKYQKNFETGTNRKEISFPVIKLVEYREGEDKLDYAIIELGTDNSGKLAGEVFQAEKFNTSSVANNSFLSIFQHPQGDPKKIGTGRLLDTLDKNVYYDDIDTYGGSSGSGVRDASGGIIGVHTNGGCDKDSGKGDIRRANRGVSSSAIAQVSTLLSK